ncbi:MAG TPA: 2TM domain-containing protein [Kofleriaceae bacterium]|nr:2TM domain-containing protein [Kofleriaceae bacterium]
MPTEEELEKIAKRRVQARLGFGIHASMYVMVNAGLLLIWAFTGAGYPWFVWPMLGWGVGVLAHALALWIGPDTPTEQRAVERELARMRAASR